MQILVTGATGILGSGVIETLLKKIPSNQISVLTRKEEKQLEFQSKGFQAYPGDYNDINALEKAMNGVDTFYSFHQVTRATVCRNTKM